MSESRPRTPVRIGILGAGFVADFYLRALRHVRGHEVTTLFARDLEKGRRVAETYGVPIVVDDPAALKIGRASCRERV
jgi:predicted dehydrogenase